FGYRTKQHFSDLAYDVLAVLEDLANEKGKSMSQVALAWVAAQPGVTSPIIGPRTMEHLEDNLGAVGIEFSEEDLRRLDEVSAPETAIVNYYTGQMMDFKPPQHRW
ncbi:MAG: aldo/keto reductase, partial [Anaerolineae bacterium]|nr:aldo/keto reductase [Anaerolineae bacterium]